MISCCACSAAGRAIHMADRQPFMIALRLAACEHKDRYRICSACCRNPVLSPQTALGMRELQKQRLANSVLQQLLQVACVKVYNSTLAGFSVGRRIRQLMLLLHFGILHRGLAGPTAASIDASVADLAKEVLFLKRSFVAPLDALETT